jgi:predicted DNA-binding ribbon-helix-helix protein
MKSSVTKWTVVIAGHKTSVSLEEPFWKALKEIADQRDMTLGGLVAKVNARRKRSNLSSAIRQHVLGFYVDQISKHPDRRKRVPPGMWLEFALRNLQQLEAI